MLIQCVSEDGKLATILPQAQYLLYENELYNVKPHWTMRFDKLVRLAQLQHEFIIKPHYKETITSDGERIKTMRMFWLDIKRNGVLIDPLFQGICLPNYQGTKNKFDIELMLQYKYDLEYYDNRVVNWKCIQRFLRKCMEKRKAEIRLALAMALHSHLGQNSVLNQLSIDLLLKFI